AVLERQSRLHAEHPDCLALAFTRAVSRVEYSIYFGSRNPSSRRAMSDDDVLGSGWGVVDGEGRAVRARARVAAATLLPSGSDKSRLLRAALAEARARRPRGTLHRAAMRLLEAGVFAQQGRFEAALARLDSAIPAFVATEARGFTTCASYC